MQNIAVLLHRFNLSLDELCSDVEYGKKVFWVQILYICAEIVTYLQWNFNSEVAKLVDNQVAAIKIYTL